MSSGNVEINYNIVLKRIFIGHTSMIQEKLKEAMLFFSLAACIGLFAVIFAISCSYAFNGFLYMFHYVGYWVLIIIPCGFFVIVYLIKNYFPEAEGSGIPQSIALGHTEDIAKLTKFFVARTIIYIYSARYIIWSDNRS
jgi:H+/Cl- antiporter ClcA